MSDAIPDDNTRPFGVVCAVCGYALVVRATVRAAALILAEQDYGWRITEGGDVCHQCDAHAQPCTNPAETSP